MWGEGSFLRPSACTCLCSCLCTTLAGTHLTWSRPGWCFGQVTQRHWGEGVQKGLASSTEVEREAGPSPLRAQVPTLASLGPLLQGLPEMVDLLHSVLQPLKGYVELEFFLLQVEGHWQMVELHRNEECQEVRWSVIIPPSISLLCREGIPSCQAPPCPVAVLPDSWESPENRTFFSG